MGTPNVEWDDDENARINGRIDQHFDYESFFSKCPPKVNLDCAGVLSMNSCGIREWIQGVQRHKLEINYVNCPDSFIEQMGNIPQFLMGSKVVSLYCYFTCENCGHEERKLFEVGQEVKLGSSWILDPPKYSCSACHKGELVFEHDPESYFSFLNHMK